ncbi:MAG: DNA-formamidopyrimidine glycosylase family protein [Dermatophilaceae bacterium]
MPEGDTVWRTAARLHEALAGAVLTTVDLRWPALSTMRLKGAVTTEVVARGKHLLHRLDSGVSIHSHLRMDGQWRVEHTPRVTPRPLADSRLRAVVASARWTALGLDLGMLDVVATADEHAIVGHLGPDLLGPDWDHDEAVRRLSASGADIGSALLDQRNLAGIGTLYAAESLFLLRINPWTPAARLDPLTLHALVGRAQQLLDANRRYAVQSTTGERAPGRSTWVHGRSGRACRRCGVLVRVARIGVAPRERVMFYCRQCQGGLAPSDDGAPPTPLGASSSARRRR